MRALVTGAGGFCGRHLARHLAAQGVEVHALSQRRLHYPHSHIADAASVDQLAAAVAHIRPDYVFHLAGVSLAADPTLYYRINTAYAAALLQALEVGGCAACPVLLVGTSAEYGLIGPEQLPLREDLAAHPYNHHGISKFAQTLIGLNAARRGRPVVIARPFNILGPGMPNHLVAQSFALQVKQILRGQSPPEIRVGNLQSSRDFIDVEEAVGIYWRLIRTPSAYGQIVNVCSGRGVFIRDLLTTLIGLSRTDIAVLVDPARYKEIDVPLHYGSTDKLQKLIGYAPIIDLENTLKRILDELLHHEENADGDQSRLQ